VAEQAGVTVVVDDAHGTGVMGATGRGTVEHFGLEGQPLVQMGTLSKALGGLGGFVAGSRDLIEYLVNRARAFIYTTALPPAQAIRPPTVPAGTSRIRLSVTAGHTPAQIDHLLEVLQKICASDDGLRERLRGAQAGKRRTEAPPPS